MIEPKLHVDLQWLNKVSYSLDKFNKVKSDVFNSRCPICGDSPTDPKKKRFYIYVKKRLLRVYCHKCGYSHSFYRFMKDQFPSMFNEYQRETLFDVFKKRSNATEDLVNTLGQVKPETVAELDTGVSIARLKQMAICLTDLDVKHPARKAMTDRGMTPRELSRLYYTDDFKEIATAINKESSLKLKEEPRIVIPFISPEGVVEMVQGRSLDKESSLRYISIKANDEVDKIYGRYELDETEIVTCVEGPLDSLFVDNAIATCDAKLTRVEADRYCWDCQPRQKEIIRFMEEAIETGKSVVIWPFVPNKKLDINDMIMMGMTRSQIMSVINKSTYSGLMAKAKFTQWKKL